MSHATRESLRLAQRLLNAARGSLVEKSVATRVPPHTITASAPPLRCFPLSPAHIGSVSSSSSPLDPPTPRDFHEYLCRKIRLAERRVHLASLYIGTGTGERELELLDALSDVPSHVQVKVLLDANRALRPVALKDQSKSDKTKKTSSAQAVYERLKERSAGGLFLFQALPEPRRLLLPSPLNEVAGVFHIKAYIIDDELILSGANLSEEYFDDRQDRYMLFKKGAGGLVQFYVDLVDALCQYGEHYRGSSSSVPKNTSAAKTELMNSLWSIMDGSNDEGMELCEEPIRNDDLTQAVVAFAVPTFQAPLGFFSSDLPFTSDAELTRTILLAAHEAHDTETTVQLSSAYLNPTDATIDLLSQLQHVTLLTAGPSSHGFAPKPGRPRRGDFVPTIFSALYRDIAERLAHAELLFFERPGWTFHAKGLWINCRHLDSGKDYYYTAAAMVGSGNFGARSEVMDVESNCILVFPQTETAVQGMLQNEWKSMRKHAHCNVEAGESSWKVRAALPFIRDLL